MDDDKPPSTEPNAADPVERTWYHRLLGLFGAEVQDREDLREILQQAHGNGLVDLEALSMLDGVLAVSEMQVRDIMVPRSQMVVVERDARPKELIPIIADSGHSRFPVIVDDRDEVAGILLAKDLLRVIGDDHSSFDISECLRPVARIPESKRLDVLLKEFRTTRNHMAIVVDEFGGTAGLVTIEDVIEQIVGDIDDEHDLDEDDTITRDGEDRWQVQALTPIEDFNEHFGASFPDQEFDTVGGLVMHELGHVPRRGERVSLGDFEMRVVRADRRRAQTLVVRRLPTPSAGRSLSDADPAAPGSDDR
jgi:hemolysin (HlyC) family protein